MMVCVNTTHSYILLRLPLSTMLSTLQSCGVTTPDTITPYPVLLIITVIAIIALTSLKCHTARGGQLVVTGSAMLLLASSCTLIYLQRPF